MFYFLGFVFPLISRIPQTCIPRIPQAASGLLACLVVIFFCWNTLFVKIFIRGETDET
ncbi:Uncharacterised protein [Candidatus Venteria ishoeyi]|uniref:Uncharacterized protein n=1 Tax=Candidatus Venteria ishoeyi TaxID=1899563 RepID=A0A1H6F5Z1_9GAMM|nr:Uncharacterised protein [Candidatus Venteria ishoeyi]